MVKFKVYRKYRWGKWRWQVKAANGKIIGASTQGYKNRQDCVGNMISLGLALNSYTDEGQ